MAKYSGSEKRKHPRLNVNFILSYRIKELPDNYDLSQTKNVSQGGMLLTTNRRFDKGTHLAITIRFPFFSKKIEVFGEVVDSKEIARDLFYETRIRFIGLDTELFKKLGEFIAERQK